MKANQLRIGNYVYRQSSKLIVDKSSVYQIENVNIQSALKYDPIPLTKEWLIKLGFEIDEVYNGLCEADFGNNPITKDYILTIKNTGNGWFYRNGYFRLNYVHQLQNIYFALTGEELNLNN